MARPVRGHVACSEDGGEGKVVGQTASGGREAPMTDSRTDHYILFSVAGTSYALPSGQVAHV